MRVFHSCVQIKPTTSFDHASCLLSLRKDEKEGCGPRGVKTGSVCWDEVMMRYRRNAADQTIPKVEVDLWQELLCNEGLHEHAQGACRAWLRVFLAKPAATAVSLSCVEQSCRPIYKLQHTAALRTGR